MDQRPFRSGELSLGYGAQKCPRCGTTQGFRPVTLQDDNTGCLMFLVGGLIPYLLYDASRSNMLACDHCGTVFSAQVPTNWGPLAALLGCAVAIAVVIALVAYLTA